MKKLPYTEGSVFLVPLRDSGFARGVVARSAPKGRILFGYFFGPKLDNDLSPALTGLNPKKAILRDRFGDLGLMNGEWQVIGIVPSWKRSEWSMPDFVRRDPLGRRKARLVRYSDTDPSCIALEKPIDDDPTLANDGLAGYGFVEIRLTKLFKNSKESK